MDQKSSSMGFRGGTFATICSVSFRSLYNDMFDSIKSARSLGSALAMLKETRHEAETCPPRF